MAATVTGLLLLAGLGSLAAHACLERQSLQDQLQGRNDEAASMLALALVPLHGDVERQRHLLAGQFDSGRFRLLRLTADGRARIELDRPEPPGPAPRWFAALLPVAAPIGQAAVGDAGPQAGLLQVALRSEPTLAALWSSVQRLAGWLAISYLLTVVATALSLRSGRRQTPTPLPEGLALALPDALPIPEADRLAAHAASEPQRRLAVDPSRGLEPERLHLQSQVDALTGLWQRQPFSARLGLALRAETQRGAGLLVVRLRQLEAMHRRLGQDGADRLLAALAQVLQSYPRRVRGALAGRLAAGDFALYLPAAGMAGETARSLAQALRAALATVDPRADLAIGAAELGAGCLAAEALAQCDRALAQAEGEGSFAVAVSDGPPMVLPLSGAREWHVHLSAALHARRLRLAECEIRDAQGRLLQLQCSPQLQLVADGPYEPEARWRAMAVRCGLSARLDLAAIGRALQAIHQDARPRSLTVAAASLAEAGFVNDVQRCLQRAAADAARLRIDVAEGALQQPRRLQAAAAAWRGAGARVGLVHPGVPMPETPQLQALGIDGVRVVAAPLQGVATQPEVAKLACELFAQLRGMQLQVVADEVGDEADRQALWGLGIDGVQQPAAAAEA